MSDLERVFDRISTRLNNVLCEMKPDYDDSIVGFNEAWDIMRAVFKDEIAKSHAQCGVLTVGLNLQAAREAVRDEVGSRLCHLTPHGTRICSRQVSSTCLCEEAARAALCSQAPAPSLLVTSQERS